MLVLTVQWGLEAQAREAAAACPQSALAIEEIAAST
jgi:ferredoxin